MKRLLQRLAPISIKALACSVLCWLFGIFFYTDRVRVAGNVTFSSIITTQWSFMMKHSAAGDPQAQTGVICADDFSFQAHERLTTDTLSLFLEGFAEYMEEIELELQGLDDNPKDTTCINSLFRTIHSLKGDCFICFLQPLGKYVHAIEDSLAGLRSGQLHYDALLKEALLIALDMIPSAAEWMVQEHKVNAELFAEVAQNFEHLTAVPEFNQDIVCKEIIACLGGSATVGILEKETGAGAASRSNAATAKAEQQQRLLEHREADEQLAYFCSLSTLLENRFPRWKERTCTIACTAMDINQQLDEPVNEQQLEAAVYLHDVGMAFFSDEVLSSISYQQPENDHQILVHTQAVAQMLQLIPQWREAGEIVLQHHEAYDGSGYPLRLKGESICLGARVLAVAIYFDALLNGRDPQLPKYSTLRALAEVNARKGTQFDPTVVDAFNRMMRCGYGDQTGLSKLR